MARPMDALPQSSIELPCPLSAGWEIVRTISLAKHGSDGQPLGGFSAAAYVHQKDRLWLLSDSSRAHLVPFTGLAASISRSAESVSLRPGAPLMLREQDGSLLPTFDGEGLVVDGGLAWITSEGHPLADRSARLVRFSLETGRLVAELPLPVGWVRADGEGLASNQGPESLTRLPGGDLLLAAEAPLLQDRSTGFGARPVAWVRLAQTDGSGQPEERARLLLPAEGQGWGLTELLVLRSSAKMLALVRGFELFRGWSMRLQLHDLPSRQASASPPLQPLLGWDLNVDGLPSDNWEGMTLGPPMPDGRSTVVLVSDDNFSPLQTSWVAVIAPRWKSACPGLAGHKLKPELID